VKLLIEDIVKVGPLASLAVIAVAFTIGILLSIRADRRDPNAEEKRRERTESMRQGAEGDGAAAPDDDERDTAEPAASHRGL
jgi:predicted RNA-binding protein with RPS1 domain